MVTSIGGMVGEGSQEAKSNKAESECSGHAVTPEFRQVPGTTGVM